MKPLLASLPQRRRNLLFAPVALGFMLLVFLVLAIATDHFLATALLTPPAGLAGAYLLLGWPVVRRADGSPLVPPRLKPWLFFPLAPALAAVLYPLLGVLLTAFRLPPQVLAVASLVLGIAGGFALAYVLVGFPPLVRLAREAWEKLPAERRPFLFFPLFVVLFLVLYFVLGVLTTRLLRGLGTLLLELQVALLLPLCLAGAAGLAYAVVGFPKPAKSPTAYLPQVTGRRRPQAFLLTFLLLGIPLTLGLGALVSNLPFLPTDLVLPLGVVLGFATSLGVAALAWGTPAKWRTFADYKPGLPPHTRLPLLVLGMVASLVVVTAVFELAGAGIFWGLLTGLAVGTLLGLKLSGATRRLAARRHAPSLLPELPDGVKPLVLFPVWFLVAGLLFTILTYVLPDLVALNFLVAVAVGLLVAVLLVEESYLKEILDERRREREKRRAFEQRRAKRLAQRHADEEGAEGSA